MNPAENSWPPEAPDPTVPTAPVAAAAPVAGPWRKNPGLAALLSLFPGVGHVYNGLYLRGVIFFLIIVSLIAAAAEKGNPFFGMSIAFFWIFNVIDAYRQATLINYGYAQDLGLLDLPKRPKAGQGGMVAGVILVLIGLVALIDQFVLIDLDWVFDLWPLAPIAIGLWLIWSGVRERRREREG
jgi:hypothetical protein